VLGRRSRTPDLAAQHEPQSSPAPRPHAPDLAAGRARPTDQQQTRDIQHTLTLNWRRLPHDSHLLRRPVRPLQGPVWAQAPSGPVRAQSPMEPPWSPSPMSPQEYRLPSPSRNGGCSTLSPNDKALFSPPQTVGLRIATADSGQSRITAHQSVTRSVTRPLLTINNDRQGKPVHHRTTLARQLMEPAHTTVPRRSREGRRGRFRATP
jgi:hypothetical protein